MRVCVFTTDLGTIAARKDDLLRQVAGLTGERDLGDVSFVGCRQSRTLDPGIATFYPDVDIVGYSRMRIANTLFRLVDAKLAPVTAARAGMRLCGPQLVEAILACDPDLVLVDVRWAEYLKAALDKELRGRVFVSGRPLPAGQTCQPARPVDPSAKVSIVLPTYNGAKYLRQSIESCLDQSYRNLELIVVDDGSADEIRSIVSEFTDPRLRYVRHEKNQGISAALNTGFALSSGDYLTWTSDDNYYVQSAIETLTRFLQNQPTIDFVYASAYIVDELGPRETLRVHQPKPPQDLKRQNALGACFLYTRRVYQDIGEHNSKAFLVEDYDYWIRVSKRFRMQRIFAPLYYYRYHKGSLTFKHGPEDVMQRFNVVKQQNEIV